MNKDTILALLGRFTEATTWTNIAALLVLAHVTVPAGLWSTITLYGVFVAAALGIIIKEGWKVALTSGDAINGAINDVAALKTSVAQLQDAAKPQS